MAIATACGGIELLEKQDFASTLDELDPLKEWRDEFCVRLHPLSALEGFSICCSVLEIASRLVSALALARAAFIPTFAPCVVTLGWRKFSINGTS
jgi:hypothetical protein